MLGNGKEDQHITAALADFTTRATFEWLTEPIVSKIKQILLDCIGCALGSYAIDRSKIAVELVEDLGGRPQATVIGGRRTSLALAAFANGDLINALDYEPNGPLVPHACPFVIPPSLAIGERVGASGKDLITALAVGLEIGGRVSSSLSQHKIPTDEPPYYKEPERQSYAQTIFGGVAGACRLLGLDSGQVANAFGIAGASTPVPAGMKALHTAPPVHMVKYNCWAGWVAQLATVATLAAEKGFTGDRTILDGEWGFWKIVGSPFFKVENLVGGLGELWHTEEVDFKTFPCCGQNQASVEGVNRIIAENDIKPEDIEEIVIKGDPMLLQSHRMQTELKSFEDAQFCNAYITAAAVYHGRRPSPAWQTPIVSQDPRIINLMKKVRVEVHPKAAEDITSAIKEAKTTSFQGSTVEIIAGGKNYVAEVMARKGTSGNPLNDQELMGKFRDNASFSMLRGRKVDEAIEMIFELEKIEDIRHVMSRLSIENCMSLAY